MVAPLAAGRIARSMVRIPGSGTDEAAGLVCLNLGNVSSFAGIVQVPQNLSLTTRNGRQQMMSSLSLTPTNEKMRGKPTSLLNDDTTNSEEKVDSTPQTIADDDVSRTTSVDVITSVVNNSSSQSSTGTTTNPTDISGTRQKRPFRQDSAEEPAVIPKRYKAMATIPSGIRDATRRPSIPILLPVVTACGTSMAVPIAHCNNGSTSTILLPGVTPQAYTHQPAGLASREGPLAKSCSVQQMVKERDQLKKENVSLKRRLFLFHQLLRNKQKMHSVLRHLEAVPS